MAKFKFYQDKEIKSWVRDYFEVEADTLEDAINFLKKKNCTLEELEEEKEGRVEFLYRDWDWMQDATIDFEGDMLGFSIFSIDLENNCEADCEVVSKY